MAYSPSRHYPTYNETEQLAPTSSTMAMIAVPPPPPNLGLKKDYGWGTSRSSEQAVPRKESKLVALPSIRQVGSNRHVALTTL